MDDEPNDLVTILSCDLNGHLGLAGAGWGLQYDGTMIAKRFRCFVDQLLLIVSEFRGGDVVHLVRPL
jgi:hypothetical protein